MKSNFDNLHYLDGMRILIVIPELTNPFYYKYLAQIMEYSFEHSKSTLVTATDGSTFGLLNRIMPFFLLRNVRKARSLFMRSVIHKADYIPEIVAARNIGMAMTFSEFVGNIGTTAKDILDFPTEFSLLNNSLHSSFVTDMANSADNTFPIRRFRKRIYKYYLDFLNSYNKLRVILESSEIDLVIFLNGRTPIQAGVREACDEMQVLWLSLEHGFPPGKRFRLDPFQDQERIANQELFTDERKNFSKVKVAEIIKEGESWLQKQEFEGQHNVFLRDNSEAQELMKRLSTDFAPIFTSSVDENISSAGWSKEDLQGFLIDTLSLSRELEKRNIQPLIVIHPNSLFKSWRDLSLQIGMYSRENIAFVPPWARISSYELIKESRVNFTWRSTIGLEMSAHGLSCYTFGDTFYDLIADVKRVNFSHLELNDFLPWRVEKTKALEYIGFLYNYGILVNGFTKDTSQDLVIREIERLIPLGSIGISLKKRMKFLLSIFRFHSYPPIYFFRISTRLLGRRLTIEIIRFLMSRIYDTFYGNSRQMSKWIFGWPLFSFLWVRFI